MAEVTNDPIAVAAAWLHDVVEDTPSTHADIEREFGPRVAELVHAMTDVEKELGNRDDAQGGRPGAASRRRPGSSTL